MSAFIVGKPHIDALIQAGLSAQYAGSPLSWDCPKSGTQRRRNQLDYLSHDAVGAMLWSENVRSVRARYPDVGADLAEAPGPIGLTAFDVRGYSFQVVSAPRVPPVVALKAIDCYEYQSCEHDGWETSEAHAFCQALRRAMIHMLPGYDEAPWGIA